MKALKRRPVLLSALFALLGGGATLLVLTHASSGAAVERERVVVAARDVEVGRALTADDVALTELPKGAAGENALRETSAANGQYAAQPLTKGEPVLRTKISSQAPGSQLAVVIPDGRVAVSVAVSEVVSTGGLIAPGDRVDVLGVITDQARDSADLVLEDVPVLAVAGNLVGASAQPDSAKKTTSRDNPTSLKSTVTLAVTTDQARRLVQVDEVAKVRLALRARAQANSAVSRTN